MLESLVSLPQVRLKFPDLSPASIYRNLPSVRIGRRRLFDLKQIEENLRKQACSNQRAGGRP